MIKQRQRRTRKTQSDHNRRREVEKTDRRTGEIEKPEKQPEWPDSGTNQTSSAKSKKYTGSAEMR